MESLDEAGADPPLTAFDDLLDQLLRGNPVDVGRFLETHPELSADERRQVVTLTGSARAGKPSPPPDPVPVDRVGGFRLIRKIGAGSTGAVYLAEDESLGRTVALKLLGPDIVGSGERAERFVREARAVAKLRHPNIVSVYAAGEEDGVRYIAMEYLPGSGLNEVMEGAASRGTLPPVRDVLRWGADLSRALEAAHQAGIVHRDVKPSNVRIAEDGRAVLLDFGIALDAGAATLTESGDFRGSPQYASPEQVGLEDVPIDARTDVYSLGVTLYELLTGAAPFRAASREQLFHQILDREPMPPRRIESSLPRDLETVVLATLEKDPARRHASAAALAADLDAVRDGRPVSVRPVSGLGRMVRWARRQPAKAALLVAVIAGVPLVAGLGGFILANLPKIEEADAAHDARKVSELLEDGFLEHGEGDPAVAQGLFEAALRLDPRSAEANAGFALARLEQRDPASALAFLAGPAGSYAAANWSLQIQVEALRRLGKNDESTTLGRTLPPLGPAIDHFVAGMLTMAKFHRIGRRDIATRAFDHLRRAVQSAPTASRLYHYEFGHAAWHALKKEEAREIAVEIQNLWPPSPEQWLAIGRTLLNADHKAAIDALEQAARTPPRSLVGREFLVRYLGESQKPSAMESAIELGRKLVAAHPSRAISHVLLGGAFLNQGDLDAALETLSAAKKLEPTDAAVHLAFAQLFMLKKEFREAEVAARESLRTAPDKIVTLQVLGAALFALNEFEEGVKPLEASLALSPDDAANLCNLGRGLCRIGEFKKGLEHLKKGHELGSASPGWSYPSKRWVVNAERKVVLEARLEEVRHGKGEAPTVEERVDLAMAVCSPKRRYAEAVGMYSEGFRIEPSFTAQQSPDYLLDAVTAAILGGRGKGVDAPQEHAGRTKLLGLARAWIAEEFLSSPAIAAGAELGPGSSTTRLKDWIAQPALAATRSLDGVDVGEAEAASWSVLWNRIDAAVSPPAPATRAAVPPVSR